MFMSTRLETVLLSLSITVLRRTHVLVQKRNERTTRHSPLRFSCLTSDIVAEASARHLTASTTPAAQMCRWCLLFFMHPTLFLSPHSSLLRKLWMSSNAGNHRPLSYCFANAVVLNFSGYMFHRSPEDFYDPLPSHNHWFSHTDLFLSTHLRNLS